MFELPFAAQDLGKSPGLPGLTDRSSQGHAVEQNRMCNSMEYAVRKIEKFTAVYIIIQQTSELSTGESYPVLFSFDIGILLI